MGFRILRGRQRIKRAAPYKMNINTNPYNSSIFVPDGTDGDSTGVFLDKANALHYSPPKD